MIDFVDAATRFPTAILTALLLAMLAYWLLAAIGLVDVDDGGLGLDMDMDVDGLDVGTVASYLVAFGLSGVPISVVVSLILLISWTLCCLAAMWLIPLIPGAWLETAAGVGALVVSFAISLPITAVALRPLRGLFVTHGARSNASLVGESCKVLSQHVDESFGRAEVNTRGASLNIKVWAHVPNTLVRGRTARILDYDADKSSYLIAADADTADASAHTTE